MTKPEALVGGMGVATTLISRLMKKAKQRGLKAQHIHLLVTEDSRAETLVDQMAERMVEVLEQELLLEEVRATWTRFYKEVLDMVVDLSSVVVPAAVAGKNEVLFMAQGLSYNKTLAACKKRFATYSYYDDLEASIDPAQEERHPDKGSYAIRHGGHLEATDGDHELSGLSAEVIRERGIKTMGELERMVWELFYEFTHPGQHPDRRDVTLSSSRYRGGHVPCARWCDGRFGVCWCAVRDVYPCLRARSVVSVVVPSSL